MSIVSLVNGSDRRNNIISSLSMIKDINFDKVDQIVIKPNFVSDCDQLASTHADAVRGILDFLKGLWDGDVIIAESSAYDTEKAFDNFGYRDLKKSYKVDLLNLENDDVEKFVIMDNEFHISKLLLSDKSFVISSAMLKTHDSVVATMGVKNILVGSILNSRGAGKFRIHQGVKEINEILASLSKIVWPDLTVIDGFTGMQGNGPCSGTRIDMGVALAGTDALAVDRVGLELMGIDASKIGYLNYCSNLGLGEFDISKIKVIGERISDNAKQFKLHDNVERQYRWSE